MNNRYMFLYMTGHMGDPECSLFLLPSTQQGHLLVYLLPAQLSSGESVSQVHSKHKWVSNLQWSREAHPKKAQRGGTPPLVQTSFSLISPNPERGLQGSPTWTHTYSQVHRGPLGTSWQQLLAKGWPCLV